jgi:arginyl-tRNA--protein-N-Asp/Glu arginylyltransferase
LAQPHQYIKANEEGFRQNMLDALLFMGYYRMQHYMFTCNDTPTSEDGFTIPVFWLRTLVQQCRPSKAASSIIKKCSSFQVETMPAMIDEEIENLYALYSNHMPFSTSETCASYLHSMDIPDPFDSWMVQVRDGRKLIAVGYFDKGHKAIAGIMNIYHPAYAAYSLGKFLIMQKLQYAIEQKMEFYYTGYISTGSTRFDYKTFPDADAVQVYLPTYNKWLHYESLGKEYLEDYYIRLLA